MAHRLSAYAIALIWLTPAGAQETLTDPTRPPTAKAESAAETAGGGPVLQSVLLPRGGTPLAIISGVRVSLGGRYGDSTVVRITESAVELAGPQGRQVLRLTPDAVKSSVSGRSAKVPQR